MSFWKKEIVFGGVSETEVMLFTKHLSVALRSGLTLIEALEMVEEQAKGRMRQVVGELMERVRGGSSFYEALSVFGSYFSPLYLNLVRSGEASGSLDENLERLAEELKATIALKKKVKGALIYPSMIFVAIFGLGLSVAFFVLPKILPLFKSLDVDLPLTTRWLLWVAEQFELYGTAILLWAVGGVIFLTWLLRRNFVKPLTHRIVLKLPGVKHLVMGANLAYFTRTLGGLLNSGLAVEEALKISSEIVGNRAYKKAILTTAEIVVGGESLQEALRRWPKLFPPITTRMVEVGERTGNLAGTLKYLGNYYSEELEDRIKNLTVIVEPILLIVIGVVVGGVALAILGPIYEITGSLRG